MAAYAQRHYGIDSYRLTDPHVIVEHFTVTDTAQAAIGGDLAAEQKREEFG